MSAKNFKKVHLMENPHARAEKTSHFTARILFSLLLLLLCLLITGYTGETVQAAGKSSRGKTVKITISAAGDCTLGVDTRYNNAFNDCYKAKGPTYFLKKVKPVFSKDDITVTNLEGPLTSSWQRVPAQFTFKGPERHASILTKGSVEVVNIANNHTMDYGKSGFEDTKKTLKKNKITYEPTSLQTSMGRYAIQCGASLVLGHHPHVLQGIEKYKGRYIVYSLGNFCYGGHTNPADKDTMIFQQTFCIKNGKLKKDDSRAKVIPCSISSSSQYNNFQPTVLSGGRKRTLINKINRISKGKHVTIKSNGQLGTGNF